MSGDMKKASALALLCVSVAAHAQAPPKFEYGKVEEM
jgi:hypothetical protein